VKRTLLVMVVGALMVAMLVVGMGAALAKGPGSAKVADEGATASSTGIGTANTAYTNKGLRP
jgi:hypothetical protein